MNYDEEFSKEKYAKADITRGLAMIVIFILSLALGFISGLLGSTYFFIGWFLLLLSLFISIFLLKRASYYTKKGSDYLIAFLLSFFTFISFWILSLNIA